jgi:hypothetical protein
MTPEGMTIDLLESKLSGSVSSQESLCNYMDDWIAEVILGQSPGPAAAVRWQQPRPSGSLSGSTWCRPIRIC